MFVHNEFITHFTKFVRIDGVSFYPGVTLVGDVTIGDGSRIGPNTSIGQSGFGYDELEDGTWRPKNHMKGVRIHDDVEVGANTCIDRGSWRHTVIGKGTKIDNLVHIAHNVHVGRNCLIVAQAMIAGSVVLEDGVWVGPGARINQRLRVSSRAFIGTGAVVTRNVDSENVVAGIPARYIRLRTADDK